MSQTNKLLLAVVAGIAATAAFWFLALTPKREEAAKLDSDIAAKQTQLDQSVAQIASYKKAKVGYKANYTTMVRLGKAVPADDDVRSLLVQINDAAARSKVDFQSINVGGGATAPTPTDAPATPGVLAAAPGSVPVGSAGFSAMPFSFAFEGSFFRLSDFFNRLEDFVTVTNKDVDVTGRLLLLGSISLTVEQGDDEDHLKATIGAASYLAPTAESVKSAAPATPPGATPPADDSTTPSTSATITGVR